MTEVAVALAMRSSTQVCASNTGTKKCDDTNTTYSGTVRRRSTERGEGGQGAFRGCIERVCYRVNAVGRVQLRKVKKG